MSLTLTNLLLSAILVLVGYACDQLRHIKRELRDRAKDRP